MKLSIELMTPFITKNIGLIIAYFLINIFTLFMEVIVMSMILSKIFVGISQGSSVLNMFCYFIVAFHSSSSRVLS